VKVDWHTVAMFVAAALWLGVALGHWLARHAGAAHRRMERRIGWGYGYGAGWVDHKYDRYDPTAPAEGRSRHEVLEQKLEPR
jgi:hypothetical protein